MLGTAGIGQPLPGESAGGRDPRSAYRPGLWTPPTPGQITVLMHLGGSRGLGHQVCDDYLEVCGRALPRYGITLRMPARMRPLTSPEGGAYLGAMGAAANFAFANRQVITPLGPRELRRGLAAERRGDRPRDRVRCYAQHGQDRGARPSKGSGRRCASTVKGPRAAFPRASRRSRGSTRMSAIRCSFRATWADIRTCWLARPWRWPRRSGRRRTERGGCGAGARQTAAAGRGRRPTSSPAGDPRPGPLSRDLLAEEASGRPIKDVADGFGPATARGSRAAVARLQPLAVVKG